MNVHVGRVLTDAIIAALEAAGLNVGDAVRPDDATATAGYVVVYGLGGGTTDGPVGNPEDDAAALYQLTSVGHDRKQAEWVADKARQVLLAATLTLTGGRKVLRVGVDMLGGVIRDDDVAPPIWYSPDRYRIFTTPS